MASSADEFQTIVDGTALAEMEVVEAPVHPGEEPALVVSGIEVADARAMWRLARTLSPTTGRWPILSPDWVHDAGNGLFAAGEFGSYVDEGQEVSPSAITARALALDLDEALRRRANRGDPSIEQSLEYLWIDEPGRPTTDDARRALAAGEVATNGELPRWLLGWDLANSEPTTSGVERAREELDAELYDEPLDLLLLPSADSWRTTSYLNFFNSGGELTTALLRDWQERWGAVVVAHHGTTMHLDVERPPATLVEAAEVTWQHDLIASSSTENAPLADYARALVGHPRWFLHEHP